MCRFGSKPPCTDFSGFHFLDLQPAALRRVLRVAARQSLFALSSKRKDLSKQGIAGSSTVIVLSCPVDRSHGTTTSFPWINLTIYLGPLTGAIPTANRLFSAGMVDQPKCRFCGATEENIKHLTQHCKGVSDVLGQQRCPLPDQPHWDIWD